jgi:hypothetical protein
MLGPQPLIGFVIAQLDRPRCEISEAEDKHRRNQRVAESEPVPIGRSFGRVVQVPPIWEQTLEAANYIYDLRFMIEGWRGSAFFRGQALKS